MLELNNTIVVCVDIQGVLAHAMHTKGELFTNVKKLLSAVSVLEIPVVWTEQTPEKLGPTLPEIAELMPAIKPIIKKSFSCCGNAQFMETLRAHGRKQVVIIGIEAHICIYQTTVDLIAQGYEVQVAADCISSRSPGNKTVGIAKMEAVGAAVTTTETVLFELLKTADAPHFQEIVRIIK